MERSVKQIKARMSEVLETAREILIEKELTEHPSTHEIIQMGQLIVLDSFARGEASIQLKEATE